MLVPVVNIPIVNGVAFNILTAVSIDLPYRLVKKGFLFLRKKKIQSFDDKSHLLIIMSNNDIDNPEWVNIEVIYD